MTDRAFMFYLCGSLGSHATDLPANSYPLSPRDELAPLSPCPFEPKRPNNELVSRGIRNATGSYGIESQASQYIIPRFFTSVVPLPIAVNGTNPHLSRPVRNAHSVPTSLGVSRESIR